MSPMAAFMLRLTNTPDIAQAEQALVQKLAASMPLDKAKRLAGQLLSDQKIPVYTMTVLPPLLGIGENEYAEAMKQQLVHYQEKHPR